MRLRKSAQCAQLRLFNMRSEVSSAESEGRVICALKDALRILGAALGLAALLTSWFILQKPTARTATHPGTSHPAAEAPGGRKP